MFPVSFEYHRATSVDDAIAALGSNPDSKILAGGHSLIPAMKLRLAAPALLVDLTRLPELKGVTIGDDAVTIGAMTTYNELRDTEGIAELYPAVVEAISVIGDLQVRAHGTIGGAIAHNDPAADLTAVFLALGGSVVAKGPNGERTISAADLFVDLWTTSLEVEEIITSVILPKPQPGTTSSYQKHSHPASGYAVVGVAAVANGSDVSIVITGATSIPTHAAAAEAAIASGGRSAEACAAAAKVASDGLELNPSPYASEAYLKQLITVLTGRALQATLGA